MSHSVGSVRGGSIATILWRTVGCEFSEARLGFSTSCTLDERGKTYYAHLGLQSNASSEEIKRAFYELSKKYHPDLNPGDKVALEKFQEISAANNVLSNPALRRQYDRGVLGHDHSVADAESSSHRYEGDNFFHHRARFRKQFNRSTDKSHLDAFIRETTSVAFKAGQNYKKKPDTLRMMYRSHGIGSNRAGTEGYSPNSSGSGLKYGLFFILLALIFFKSKF